jgi:hypothetical protein
MSGQSGSPVDPAWYRFTTRLRIASEEELQTRDPAAELSSLREAERARLWEDPDEVSHPVLTFEQLMQLYQLFDVLWLSLDVFICSRRLKTLGQEWENLYHLELLTPRNTPLFRVPINLFVYTSSQAQHSHQSRLRLPFHLLRSMIKICPQTTFRPSGSSGLNQASTHPFWSTILRSFRPAS